MIKKIDTIQQHVVALEKDFELNKYSEVIKKFAVILFIQIDYALEENITEEEINALQHLKLRVSVVDLLNNNKFINAVVDIEEGFNTLLKKTSNLREQLSIIESSKYNQKSLLDIHYLKDRIENIYFTIHQNKY